LVAPGSQDREIGHIDIELKIVRQAIIKLEIGGVLPHIRVLKLKRVVLIEELEVPFATVGGPGVIRIEGQLSVKMRRETDQERQRQELPNARVISEKINNQSFSFRFTPNDPYAFPGRPGSACCKGHLRDRLPLRSLQ
jgi:hypothetical protein